MTAGPDGSGGHFANTLAARRNTMDMFKPTAIAILIGTSLLLSSSAGRVSEAGSCEQSSYDVMSMLIQEEYGTDFEVILINSETESWCLDTHLDFLQQQWPELRRETIDSLITRNSGISLKLEANIKLSADYILISEIEYLEALQDSSGHSKDKMFVYSGDSSLSTEEYYEAYYDSIMPNWDNFDKVYPDAQGYLTFSRVGFDSECTQALLIYSNAYRCSGDRVHPKTRKIAYFKNRNGTWELVGVSRRVSAMY